ncbi:hypothetical protein C8F04DRAFT_987586 [Mycena alexandri]|uniref:MYND-type domain-containing protein n=1 Tax=Mycena alexandri TaxID=1745969 RepID=A0AAD6TNN1_9AGAR|nr:hypothetical protein C8F04DRAFT_987586 [Mycena alexandri]
MAPHLPLGFLAKLFAEPFMKEQKSLIFSPEIGTIRADLADQNKSEVRDINLVGHVVDFEGGCFTLLEEERSSNGTNLAVAPGESPYSRYTLMHVAVDNIDPPLACEMVRHGFPVDTPNGRGETPLLLALDRLWAMHTRHKSLPNNGDFSKEESELAQRSLRYIIVLLIEQHANVNATVKWQGHVVSSLHFACAVEDWELVALLLKYGAQPRPTLSRPPRLCPCFSEKPLSDCHAGKELAYPDHFICSCGSTTEYGRCCKMRGISLVEGWDEERTMIVCRRIAPPLVPGVPTFASPEAHALTERFKQHLGRGTEEVTKFIMELARDPAVHALTREALEVGCRETTVADPAFSFAYLETKFLPIPKGRNYNKHWCYQLQTVWNAAVDKYIAKNVDSRPRLEIEAAAKVGNSLGAMYRACEAEGCDKVEGQNIGKVLTCSRCQMSFYCGPACQKSHWRTHKKICGSVGQTEPALPSKVALCEFAIKYETIKQMGDARLGQSEVLEMVFNSSNWDFPPEH